MELFSNKGIKLSSDDSIFMSGPACIKANGNSYLSVENNNIKFKSNSLYLNGPVYIGTAFFAGPDGVVTIGNVKPVLYVTSSDGSVTVAKSDYNLDLKASGGFNPIYYAEIDSPVGYSVKIQRPWSINLDATHSVYMTGPYVFMGDHDTNWGVSCKENTGISIKSNKTIHVEGPIIKLGKDNGISEVNLLSHMTLRFNSMFVQGPRMTMHSEDTEIKGTRFILGPTVTQITGTRFTVGPSEFINLNQPEKPGISISPNSIVISMTENAGTARQVIGTTLTLDRNTAKIAAYSVGSGKEFTFNVHSVDVLDKDVNGYFENLTRVDGIGGSGAWNKMKNHGMYYFNEFERTGTDFDFSTGALDIDVDSNTSATGVVRTAELHVNFNKDAIGITWPSNWQWVDEADPSVPPSIPASEHGRWCCFIIRKSVMPNGDTFTAASLPYIYGTAITSE